MKRTIGTLLAATLTLAVPAISDGFNEDNYEAFMDGRVGTGEPVYWYSVGTIKSYPEGELLFQMEGFDAARAHRPDPEEALTHQYNRKIYFYKNAETGDILTEWNENPIEPIAYPYQFITYELKGETIETMVEQGKEPNIQRLGPGTDISARQVGDSLVVTAPVYLDFEIPGTDRRIDAFENYDFFFHPEGSVTEANQLAWVRYGDLPAWAGGGKAIYHLVTWRIDDWADMPSSMKETIERDYPLWMAPPASIEDIRALQAPVETDDASKGF
ncbi:MAG: hypothetical protein AAF292_07870 [Pseudomonadota bacterium]